MEIPLARRRLDRFATSVLAAYAVVFTGLVLGAFWLLDGAVGTGGLLLIVGGLVLAWLGWSTIYLVNWLRMRRVDVPLELQPTGLIARSQFGEITAPWETVTSAALEGHWSGRRLRVRLVPASDPRHAAVVAEVIPQMLRLVERQGLRYSLRVLDIGPDQLREQVLRWSGGRVRVD